MATFTAYSHEFVKELTDAGMPEKQAEVVVRQQAEIIDHNLATKNDLKLLRNDLELLRNDLKKDMALLKKDLIIKLGCIIVGGWVATIGIILGFLPMMLR